MSGPVRPIGGAADAVSLGGIFGDVPPARRLTPAEQGRDPALLATQARYDRTTAAMTLVRAEVDRASGKHRPFNSSHEGYGVLLEEVDELWDEVKANRRDLASLEAIQVAAMAVRFLVDCGDWHTEVAPGGSNLRPVLTAAVESEVAKVDEGSGEHAYALSTLGRPGLIQAMRDLIKHGSK